MDDIQLNRAVLRRVLESAGATVVEACDGRQAVELFSGGGGAASFPLVLLDLQMPRVDGWTAAACMRSLESTAGWAHAAIVACSTEDLSPGSPALARCWEAGMDAARVSAGCCC